MNYHVSRKQPGSIIVLYSSIRLKMEMDVMQDSSLTSICRGIPANIPDGQ